MPEKNNELVVVKSWKDDLKAEASVQVKVFTITCMQNLKIFAGEYAKYAVQRIIDYWIDCINA